jgi:hypothetical protein
MTESENIPGGSPSTKIFRIVINLLVSSRSRQAINCNLRFRLLSDSRVCVISSSRMPLLGRKCPTTAPQHEYPPVIIDVAARKEI